jgi:hypothetical protein
MKRYILTLNRNIFLLVLFLMCFIKCRNKQWVIFRNESYYEFVLIRRKITAIFPTLQVKRAVVLVVLTLEPVTQKGRSASTLVTSRLALFFSVKENQFPIFDSVINYTDTHSFMVSFLMRNVATLSRILPTSGASLGQNILVKIFSCPGHASPSAAEYERVLDDGCPEFLSPLVSSLNISAPIYKDLFDRSCRMQLNWQRLSCFEINNRSTLLSVSLYRCSTVITPKKRRLYE